MIFHIIFVEKYSNRNLKTITTHADNLKAAKEYGKRYYQQNLQPHTVTMLVSEVAK